MTLEEALLRLIKETQDGIVMSSASKVNLSIEGAIFIRGNVSWNLGDHAKKITVEFLTKDGSNLVIDYFPKEETHKEIGSMSGLHKRYRGG